MWSQLKSASYKFYPPAILKECRQAEEFALKAYDEALTLDFSTGIRKQLSLQKRSLKKRYDELTRMTTQMELWAVRPNS